MLKGRGIRHSVEHCTPDGLLHIDFLLSGPEHTHVALELDDRFQFTALPPHTPLGGTALRDRLLRQRGFTVLSVPFDEWKSVHGQKAKREFLMKCLVKAGVSLPK